MIRLLVAGTNY